MRTVSTSLLKASKILIFGGGASGAEVMEIVSGSLMGIMPKVMFRELISYVHLTLYILSALVMTTEWCCKTTVFVYTPPCMENN